MDRCLIMICTLAISENMKGNAQVTMNNSILSNSSSVMNAMTPTSVMDAITPTSVMNAITPTSVMNTTNLVCQNGVLLTGFCLCQDDWSGTVCNIPNFCPEQRLTHGHQFIFPKTFLGQFASSRELCPPGTSNAGIPQASALCNIDTHMFNSPNILECGLTLDNINEKVSVDSVEDKRKLASSTQILTSIPERLTSQNITNAVKIASILLSDNPLKSTDIAVPMVATVSQLLSTSHEKFSNVNDISLLTQRLQKLSLNEGLNNLLVQPNLAVQSIKGTTQNQQVQLTLFKGQNDTFLPNRLKLSSSQDVPETHQKNDVEMLQMNITFTQGFNKDVGFVLYDNDQFFQSKSFKSLLNTKRKVISANPMDNHQLNMEFKFAVTASNSSKVSLHKFACVFWNYNKKDWSTEGCTKTESSSDRAVCSCKSQTPKNLNFAILMTFNINYQYSEALHWISIIGCSLSIVGLAVTAIYQVVTRKSRGCSPTLLLVNICLSMTIFYLLFIFGINNPVKHAVETISEENTVPVSDYQQYSDAGPCTAFTALIHYFLLATFTWNTLYGINVFLLFKTTISGTPPWFPKMSLAVGWGFPAVIVGITLGSTYRIAEPLGYRQEEFCWLAFLNYEQKFDIRKPMFWGFLLPLVIMLISNMAMVLHFSHNICKTNPNLNRSRKTPLRKKILSSFSLAVMLGLSWVTGYLLLITRDNTLSLILSIVFCVCNTTQGIQIFILFTLRSLLKSRPAVLNAPVQNIGLHRKTLFLWKAKKAPECRETYTSTDPNCIRPPQVTNGPE